MGEVRRDRALWDSFETHSEVLPNITEEPWWRQRFLSASARSAMMFGWAAHQYQRWMAIGIVLASTGSLIMFVVFNMSYAVTDARVITSLAVLLVTGVPVAAVAANLYLPVKAYATGFALTYISAYLSSIWMGRPGVALPIFESVETAPLPFALTLTAVLMAIGTLVTGLIEIAAVMTYKIVMRALARDYPSIGILRVVADLSDVGDKWTHREAQLIAGRARYIYRMADIVERLTMPLLRRGDSLSHMVNEHTSLAARHLRVLALRLLIASRGERVEIVFALRRIALCLLLGMYGKLVELDEGDIALLAAARRRRSIHSWITWTLATALPATAVMALYLLELTIPATMLQWITAFAVIWLIVRVIAVLEPNYRAAVDTAMDLVNASRELPGRR